MKLPLKLSALIGIAMLATCTQEPTGDLAEDAQIKSDEPMPVEPDSGIGDEANSSEQSADTASTTVIPAALQGRWGLVAADCETGRSDAKGLMVVSATGLTFYESRGTLDNIVELGDNRIRASFAFTGEGMEWDRDMVLDIQDGGTTLTRRDYGKDAVPGPLKYTKCP